MSSHFDCRPKVRSLASVAFTVDKSNSRRYGQCKAECDQCENVKTGNKSTKRHSYDAKKGRLEPTCIHEWSTTKINGCDIPSRAKVKTFKKIVIEGTKSKVHRSTSPLYSHVNKFYAGICHLYRRGANG